MTPKKTTTSHNNKNTTLLIGIVCVLLGVAGVLFMTNDKVMQRFNNLFTSSSSQQMNTTTGANDQSTADQTNDLAQDDTKTTTGTQKNNRTEENVGEETTTTLDDTTTGGTAQQGNKVRVDYIGKLTNGEVFDTSYEEIAREYNIYQSGRNYDEGLTFVIGSSTLLPKFEQALIGVAIGEQVTVEIPAAEAYGERPQRIAITQLPPKADQSGYATGEMLQTNMGQMEIVGIDQEYAQISPLQMHPLANQDLIFDITLREIY